MPSLKDIEPTLYFIREKDELKQLVEVTIESERHFTGATIEFDVEGKRHTIPIGAIDPGVKAYRLSFPDVRAPSAVRIALTVKGEPASILPRTWRPTRHWRLFVVQGPHIDLGYTDLPSNVERAHDRFLDTVVQYCDQTADWPEDSRFAYKVEVSWPVIHYIRNRPKGAVDRLLRFLREGRIEVSALFAHLVTDLCGHEEIIRLLYPSLWLEREHGVPIRTAEVTDIQGLSWALASALAGAGIRYFSLTGVRPFWDTSVVTPKGVPAFFRWIGPDGNGPLFLYGDIGGGFVDDYAQSSDDWEGTPQALPRKLFDLQSNGFPFDAVRFRVNPADNVGPSLRYSHMAREWNARWAYPRMIIATNADYFAYVSRSLARVELPVFRGELPNADYTVGAASTARDTGVNRIAHDILLAAEKFSSIASALADYPYPCGQLAEAYEETLLYDEHTWGMKSPNIGPTADAHRIEKSLRASRALALAQDCLSMSLNRIADRIHIPDEGYRIIVFNPLSWERTDVVYAYLSGPTYSVTRYRVERDGMPPIFPKGTAIGRNIVFLPISLLDAPFEILDETTGTPAPHQIIGGGGPDDASPMASQRYVMAEADPALGRAVVFVAERVPPVGYRTYRIVPCARTTPRHGGLKVTPEGIENRFYSISFDPRTGTIRSIRDRESNRELTDAGAPHRFNQYVACRSNTGREEPCRRFGIEAGKKGPVAGSIVTKGSGAGCSRILQEVTLYDSIKRIDLANRLVREPGPFLGIHFAFPFGIDNPRYKVETTGGVLTPIEDQMPGSSTDFYAMQHWADVSGEDFGVCFSSIEAHLIELGGLRPTYGSTWGYWPASMSPNYRAEGSKRAGSDDFRRAGCCRKGCVYSYVMENNFSCNFSSLQEGDVLFRYAITSHTGDWTTANARDFGWGFHNPLIPIFMKGGSHGVLPGSQSFCSLDAPNVMCLNVKKAENREGFILRLVEVEGTATDVTVTLPLLEIAEASLATHGEEVIAPLRTLKHEIKVPVSPFGTTTVRIRTFPGA